MSSFQFEKKDDEIFYLIAFCVSVSEALFSGICLSRLRIQWDIQSAFAIDGTAVNPRDWYMYESASSRGGVRCARVMTSLP